MFLTPLRRPVTTSPPAVISKRAQVPRFTDKMRGLDFPEHIANDMTTFEKGCYYATTRRDVNTMQVFFLEVVDVYAETIVYRIAPQSLRCFLTLQAAKIRLQNAECNVGSVGSILRHPREPHPKRSFANWKKDDPFFFSAATSAAAENCRAACPPLEGR